MEKLKKGERGYIFDYICSVLEDLDCDDCPFHDNSFGGCDDVGGLSDEEFLKMVSNMTDFFAKMLFDGIRKPTLY